VRPVVCMITDRRRLAAGGEDVLVERVTVAAAAGVDLVQIRERDMDARALSLLVTRCLEAVKGSRTRVLVNDRLDVALATGAHGVHLRSDSMPAARARLLTPTGFLIGRSIHSVDEAVAVTAAGGVDYLVFGSVFASASKPGHPPAGVRTLADVAAATSVPVLAVGGVGADTMTALAHTGSAGFAAIGWFTDGDADTLRRGLEAAAHACEKG
jgi:thiamine-phosphate diphosphorylase